MRLKSFIFKFIKSKKYNNSIYEIVEQQDSSCIYTIRLKYFRSKFKISIEKLVEDKNLLYNLSSIQSAYIGYEYSSFLIKNGKKSNINNVDQNFPDIRSRSEYYEIVSITREHNILFKDLKSFELINLDPRDIFLSYDLISKFDPAQAYFIGINAFKKFELYKEKMKEEENNSNTIDFILKRKLKMQRQNYI